MSTSGVGNQYWPKEKGSNKRPARNAVCTIDDTPRNMKMRNKTLLSTQVRTGIQAAPITFRVGDEQYVSVVGGWGASLGVFTGDASEDPDRDAVGRVIAYKLGGTVTLPPATVMPRKIPDVAAVDASPEIIAHGKAVYLERCSWCHGFDTSGTGSYPDLKYASAATHSIWNSIVLDGAYFEKGMPAFGEFLNEDDAQAIRAYVLGQAETAFESQN